MLSQCFKYAYVVSCLVCLFLWVTEQRDRRSRPEVFCEKDVPRNFAKFTGLRSQACKFIKIETLAQVLSSEFCKISKNTFSYRTPPVAASAEVCSQPSKFKMELFAKIVNNWKSVTIFTNLHLRCLAGVWIRLCWIQGKLLARVCYMLKYITSLK